MKQKMGIILIIALLLSTISTAVAAEDTLNLKSEAIILIEKSTGKIIFEKNAHQRMFPASTVKILTALVALENSDPEDLITIGNEVLQVPLDASKAGHVPGDQIKMKDLIKALLLPSGNDSAFSIASYIIKKTTGNEDVSSEEANAKFALLMNEKAKAIGAKESNFMNPHGYHDDNNYTTPYDLAIITREALNNPLIKETVAIQQYSINSEGQRAFDWKNRNLLLDPRASDYYYQYANGVKTGYTEQAGETLIGSATKDGIDLIAVIMNSPKDMRWGDAKTLFEYGFNNYTLHTIVKKDDNVAQIAVEQATKKGASKLEGIATEEATDILKNEDLSRIEQTITWNKNPFVAPIVAGQSVGKVTYTLDGQVLAEVELVAKTAIAKQTFGEFVFSIQSVPYWGGALGGLMLLMLIIFIIKKRKNSHRGYHFR